MLHVVRATPEMQDGDRQTEIIFLRDIRINLREIANARRGGPA